MGLLLFLPLRAIALLLSPLSIALDLMLFFPSLALALFLYPFRMVLAHLLALQSRALALIFSPLCVFTSLITNALEDLRKQPLFSLLLTTLVTSPLQIVVEEVMSNSWEISWPIVSRIGDTMATARWFRLVGVVGQVFEQGRASHCFLPLEYIQNIQLFERELKADLGVPCNPSPTLEEMESNDIVCEAAVRAKIEWWETRMEDNDQEDIPEAAQKTNHPGMAHSDSLLRAQSLLDDEGVMPDAKAPENTSEIESALPGLGHRRQPVDFEHLMGSQHLLKESSQAAEETHGSVESQEVPSPGLLNSWVPSLCRAYVDQLTLQAATYTAQLTPPPPPVGLRTSRPLGMESPSLVKAIQEGEEDCFPYQDQEQSQASGDMSASCELTDVPDHYVENLNIELLPVSRTPIGDLYIIVSASPHICRAGSNTHTSQIKGHLLPRLKPLE